MAKSIKSEIEKTAEDLEKEKLEKDRIEKERVRLQEIVISGDIKTDREKVAFILNSNVKARNSDAELAWSYWEMFEKDFDGGDISKEEFRSFKSYKSIHRQRATIQNKYRLFQADVKVRKYRGVLEEEKRQEAIDESKQSVDPITEVFIDESGKTGQFLIVGGLWISNMKSKVFGSLDIKKWKKDNDINYEFHFAELSKQKLDIYKLFFSKFLASHTTAGFKVTIVDKEGNKNLNEAFTHLTFHHLWQGINQEDLSGRAGLPRQLQIRIDEENKGSDQIKIENIRERILNKNISGLAISELSSVSSSNNIYVQVVDLFVASVNRVLHPQETRNQKDELADFILQLVGLDLTQYEPTSNIDNATVFDLTINS